MMTLRERYWKAHNELSNELGRMPKEEEIWERMWELRAAEKVEEVAT